MNFKTLTRAGMVGMALAAGTVAALAQTPPAAPAAAAVANKGDTAWMITATVLAIFFVPVFFVVVRRRFSRKNEDVEHSHSVEPH